MFLASADTMADLMNFGSFHYRNSLQDLARFSFSRVGRVLTDGSTRSLVMKHQQDKWAPIDVCSRSTSRGKVRVLCRNVNNAER